MIAISISHEAYEAIRATLRGTPLRNVGRPHNFTLYNCRGRRAVLYCLLRAPHGLQLGDRAASVTKVGAPVRIRPVGRVNCGGFRR